MHNNKISIYSVSNKIRQQMNSFMYQIEYGISLTWWKSDLIDFVLSSMATSLR